MVDREALKQQVRLMPAASLLELAERAMAQLDAAKGEIALAEAMIARASQSMAEALLLIDELKRIAGVYAADEPQGE